MVKEKKPPSTILRNRITHAPCHRVHNHVTIDDVCHTQVELTENPSPPSTGSSFQPLGSIGDVLGFDRRTRSQCRRKRMETKSGSFFSAFGKVVERAASHVSPRTRHAS